jgi:hypothetical protein
MAARFIEVGGNQLINTEHVQRIARDRNDANKVTVYTADGEYYQSRMSDHEFELLTGTVVAAAPDEVLWHVSHDADGSFVYTERVIAWLADYIYPLPITLSGIQHLGTQHGGPSWVGVRQPDGKFDDGIEGSFDTLEAAQERMREIWEQQERRRAAESDSPASGAVE